MQAVARVLEGESPKAVISSLGFHRSRIYEWLAKYEANGEQGLETQLIPGRSRKFPDEYADRLRKLIKVNPLQLFRYALKRTIVLEHISTLG